MQVSLKDFRHDVKNTRKGYFTAVVDGIQMRKCAAHKHPAGKVWAAFPAIQRQDGGYENVVCFDNPELNEEFQKRIAELLQPYLKDD